MEESEWKHAGWVSGFGKWAWIILLVQAPIRILLEILWVIPRIVYWESFRPYYTFLGQPMPPMPIGAFIFGLIGGILTLVVSLVIIRPKFSKPCGDKDWDALLGWALNLGSLRVPWMFIWGAIFAIFSLFYAPAIFMILPAVMIIFAGPKKYNWTSKEKKAEE